MLNDNIAGRRVLVDMYNNTTREPYTEEMTALALGTSNHNSVLICEQGNGEVWSTPLDSFKFIAIQPEKKELLKIETFSKGMKKKYEVEGKVVFSWMLTGRQAFPNEADAQRYVGQLREKEALAHKNPQTTPCER